ncbi:MAG: spore cortex biosynthesis protein YabQ [Clostridia bacterium]|nr:spore cortex biosynthesis protein YabQ [Clostridia bacterium]
MLLQLWLYAFLLGVGLGAVYDAFRITRVFLGVSYSVGTTARLQSIRLPYLRPRRARRPSRVLGVVIFFEDLAFALIGGVSMILLFYQINNGKIRFPAFLCAAAGYFLYRLTIGRLVIRAAEVIAFGIETLVRYAVFFITLPFCLIGRRIAALVRRLWQMRRERIMKRARQRATARAWHDLEKDAGGLIPRAKKREESTKEVRHGGGKEKTIQSEHSGAHLSGAAGGDRDRRVRRKRHAL